MSHPFDGEDHRRLSPSDAAISILEDIKSRICLCGSRKLSVQHNVETFPKFDDAGIVSTCDVVKCQNCGRTMEIAYSITYSVCVLAEGAG